MKILNKFNGQEKVYFMGNNRFCIRFLVILMSVFAVPLFAFSQDDFFYNPVVYSTEELSQELDRKTLDMCWNLGQDSRFRFVSNNDEVYFEICLGSLPDFYNDFLARVKNKFIVNSEDGNEKIIFSYKIKNLGQEEEINIPHSPKKEGNPNEYSYIVTDRRVFESARPKLIHQEKLEGIIKNKNVLFYTGAGLSLASDVPAMNELNELLELEEGERFFLSLEKALENPKDFASKILVFHKACLFSSPTPAHIALKELAFLKNIRLITENLDCLHEASGIYPYRIDAKHLREEVGGKSLMEFDYIICIGLSHDDRGFLGWYKQKNPSGKIIAVDINQPSYLGDEDFLMQGDLQEIIPSIRKAVGL